MRHSHFSFCVVIVFAVAVLAPAPSSAMELDGFLGEINVNAGADIGGFRADLSATFGVSSGEVDGLFKICSSPADVYMTLRIGEVAELPIDRVVAQYKAHKDQGWGVIAKNLGIKPGSPEFHALKQGRLQGHSRGAASGEQGKGKGTKGPKGGK